MTILEIEELIFWLEEIRVIIRAPKNLTVENGYNYDRKATGSMTIQKWRYNRLKNIIGDLEISVVAGDGSIVSEHSSLKGVRDSYNV